MDARAVVARGGKHIRLERGAKSKVPANAETDDADFSARHFGMARKPIQSGAAVGIEVRDGSLRRILLAARAASVVKRDYRARRLDAPVNLRRRSDESVSGQAHAE